MTISAKQVKILRERTGAGMMDCRKALEASGGDVEKAIAEMRKSGQAKAAKKASRVAAEGLIAVKQNDRAAVLLEVNCETDFVARDENFVRFADKLGALALQRQIDDIEKLNAAEFDAGKTVEAHRQELVSTIGENIKLRRLRYLTTDDVVAIYVHGEGRIAVAVTLAGGDVELGRNVAMHIAAMNPQAIGADDMSPEILAKEREIFAAQAAQSGKPAEIVEKMVAGRMKKFLAEVTLEGQPYVRDSGQSVGELLRAAGAKVTAFCRFEVGEGVEKKEENFADEVRAIAQSDN